MARMGRPPRWATVSDFVNECKPALFFDWCAENGYKPLWEWFAVYCNCDRNLILEYAKKDGITPDGSYIEEEDFASVIKGIGARINAFIIDNGLEGKYRDALTIFYLKNYGYTDRQEVTADMTVKLSIDNDGLFD